MLLLNACLTYAACVVKERYAVCVLAVVSILQYATAVNFITLYSTMQVCCVEAPKEGGCGGLTGCVALHKR